MLKRFLNPYNNQNPNQFQNPTHFENYDYKRLETELNESKRMINELTKRVTKLENYLGVRNDQKYYY